MTVPAAASLTNAFNEIKGMFEKKHAGLQVKRQLCRFKSAAQADSGRRAC